MMQMKSQMQPQDPNVQALVQTQMAETNRKAADDKARIEFDVAKLSADVQAKQEKNVADEQIKGAEITHDINLMTLEQKHEMEKQQQMQMAQAQQAEQAAQQEMAMAQQQAQQQAAPPQQMPPQPNQGI
jgi:hypothetical protein